MPSQMLLRRIFEWRTNGRASIASAISLQRAVTMPPRSRERYILNYKEVSREKVFEDRHHDAC
jgi:hypothetical protein